MSGRKQKSETNILHLPHTFSSLLPLHLLIRLPMIVIDYLPISLIYFFPGITILTSQAYAYTYSLGSFLDSRHKTIFFHYTTKTPSTTTFNYGKKKKIEEENIQWIPKHSQDILLTPKHQGSPIWSSFLSIFVVGNTGFKI